jgi:hypothetical protein
MNDYYILVGEEQKGPYSIGQLKSMWASGQITTNSLYWQPGFSEWRSIKELQGELVDTPVEAYVQPPTASIPQSGNRNVGKAEVVMSLIVMSIIIFVMAKCNGCEADDDKPRRQPTAYEQEKNEKFEAYVAAKQIIKKKYPGVKEIASYGEAQIRKEGSTYYIAVMVDGVNAFNAPVRKVVGLSIHRSGEQWIADEIGQF